MNDTRLKAFIRESNKIEGITLSREGLLEHMGFYRKMLKEPLTVENLCFFVDFIQPGARLRDRERDENGEVMNVHVGDFVPPPGGIDIRTRLEDLLADVHHNKQSPFVLHKRYENLHPFMDGNGRSGRFLWLWQMTDKYAYGGKLGFLHAWYYQSLSENG